MTLELPLVAEKTVGNGREQHFTTTDEDKEPFIEHYPILFQRYQIQDQRFFAILGQAEKSTRRIFIRSQQKTFAKHLDDASLM